VSKGAPSNASCLKQSKTYTNAGGAVLKTGDDAPDKKRKEKGRAEGVQGGGSVLAFERDRVREQVLRRQVAKLGCGGRVTCFGQDFTIAAARAVNRAKKVSLVCKATQLRLQKAPS